MHSYFKCVFSTLQKRAKGQALLDLVFNHLELIEKDFFGLQYLDHSSSSSAENPKVNISLEISHTVFPVSVLVTSTSPAFFHLFPAFV